MIGLVILAALLQQQGPRSLDIDPSKVQPPVVVAAGTVIPVTLTSRINTKNAKDGDGVYGKTTFPITINNKIVIPEGSFVRGKVTEVRRPGRVKGKAELTLNFQTLVLPSGITVPIYTSLGGIGGEAKRKGEATAQGDGGKGKDAGTIGTTAADLFVEQDRAHFYERLREVLATGKEGTTVEMHVPTTAGATLTMELDMVPIEKVGSASKVLLQLSDITEKKQLAQQLLRSERLASLSQFASMFAHDIRNPLAGIKKTLELLGHRRELQAEPLARLFGDLQFTSELLLGMINDMVDVYQESYSGLPLVSSTFSASSLLQEVAHLFRSEAEAKGVVIRVEPPQEDVMLTGDRRRLQRVGINLLHNALKYSPPEGIITLSARSTPEAQPALRSGLPDEPVLLIQVEDEGPGVDPTELPHIFEMFHRKKDGHDLRIGRGLGLHFCRLVVEAHHGRIWAANRPLGGAVFAVALPLDGGEGCRSGS